MSGSKNTSLEVNLSSSERSPDASTHQYQAHQGRDQAGHPSTGGAGGHQPQGRPAALTADNLAAHNAEAAHNEASNKPMERYLTTFEDFPGSLIGHHRSQDEDSK